MSPEEMLLDPWNFATEPAVPPVRTIVLDRAPTPVRPVREREAVRSVSSTAGPERLSLRDVSIAYAGKPAVNLPSPNITVLSSMVRVVMLPSPRNIASGPFLNSNSYPWTLPRRSRIGCRAT